MNHIRPGAVSLVGTAGVLGCLWFGSVSFGDDHASGGPFADPVTVLQGLSSQPQETYSGKVLPPPESLPYTVGADQEAFFSLYRRPNDDTFQNGGDPTQPGTPFQVGWMWCSLIATKGPDGSLKSLDFRWDFENLTGRHTAAPEAFVLRESRSSMAGETEPVRYPSRPRDSEPNGLARVSTRYPDGATESSPTNLKRGTRSSSLLTVINSKQTPLADGEYSGNLEVRIDPELYGTGTRLEGLEQTEGTGGPKDGVYKKVDWKVKVKDGKIVSEDVNCARFNPNQPLQLASNNLGKPSPFAETGYPEQTPAAECKSDTEHVGAGEDLEPELVSRADRLTRAIGKEIASAGCLNCHGDGTGDLFRFCDDGRPLWAREDSAKLYSMLLYGVPHRPTPPEYPDGMIQSIMALRQRLMADDTGGGLRATLREWVESQKSGAKMESPDKEMGAMRAAQMADQNRLDETKTK